MEGFRGFLQLWVQVDEPTLTLVSATAGKYDRETVVDAIREEYASVAPRLTAPKLSLRVAVANPVVFARSGTGVEHGFWKLR